MPTVYLGSCRDIMVQVKAPRSVFLDYPLGRQCGKPFDVALQKSILTDTLNFLVEAGEPGLVLDLPLTWGEPFDFEGYSQDSQAMIIEEGLTTQEWKPN